MLTFTVEKHYIEGETKYNEVYSDGESIEGYGGVSSAENGIERVVLGYYVNIYDDNNLVDSKYYPTTPNFNTEPLCEDGTVVAHYNREEILHQIKADFPPKKYQNHNW